MTKVVVPTESGPITVELKDRNWAAFLAWMLPGLGHLYQGRTAKGCLLMISILSLFFFGLWLGQGHVVYASFKSSDLRLPYLCQVATGGVALPAMVQTYRVNRGREPLWNGLMAPPRPAEVFQGRDELAEWHARLHRYFELGTVYTMIAGLLNVLAIFDAWAGPMPTLVPSPETPAKKDDAPPQPG